MAAKRQAMKESDRRADKMDRMDGMAQEKRDRELDAWMDRALGVRKPDPQPVVRDL